MTRNLSVNHHDVTWYCISFLTMGDIVIIITLQLSSGIMKKNVFIACLHNWSEAFWTNFSLMLTFLKHSFIHLSRFLFECSFFIINWKYLHIKKHINMTQNKNKAWTHGILAMKQVFLLHYNSDFLFFKSILHNFAQLLYPAQ